MHIFTIVLTDVSKQRDEVNGLYHKIHVNRVSTGTMSLITLKSSYPATSASSSAEIAA